MFMIGSSIRPSRERRVERPSEIVREIGAVDQLLDQPPMETRPFLPGAARRLQVQRRPALGCGA